MKNIPSKIGKYRIESLLGTGGMGRVYKAIDLDIPAEVALKVIRPELFQDADKDQLLNRFRNEVIACRRVKHPNIVATYDYHESGDNCYIVMEYVQGKLLSDLLDTGYSFDIEQILAIMKQLLSALQCAHNHGVTHRDIKPSNIMINDDGVIQVADFGIEKLATSELTVTGTVIGSPAYMSPEQCLGKPVDNRSDIFSAGIVLYQLLTGEKPFSSENPASTIQKIVNATVVHASLLN